MKKEKSTFAITSNQRLATLAITCMLACVFCLTPASARAETSKPNVIRQLNEWRGRVIADDEKASSEQKKLVLKLSQISFKRDLRDALASQIAERDLESPMNDIGRIDDDRVELEARRRIVDQMIFAIDTKWSGSDLRSFLESLLLDLAITDLSEPGQGGWWEFLIQASISLRETAEPGADPIKFLEAYMADSGVLDPKSALDLIKSRNYVGH